MSPTVPPTSTMTHVRVAVARDARDPLLDLVGDVRDDLDGAAEVVAAALLGDDRLVDPAGGDVGELGQVLVDEPLVVAEVEVRLGAVVGDEDLAVLVRATSCPGSTLMYGSSLRMETLRPRALSRRPMLAAVMPLPSEEVTPPVTKTYFAMGRGPPGVFPMLPEDGTGCEIRVLVQYVRYTLMPTEARYSAGVR